MFKKILIIAVLIFASINLYSQNNYGVKRLSKEDINKIKNQIDLTNKRSNVNKAFHKTMAGKVAIADYIDNSTSKYFPPIILQEKGSCSCASTVYYIFTYDYNKMENRLSSEDDNQFAYLFTYNLVNDGYDSGSYGYDVMRSLYYHGAMPKNTYNTNSITEWPNGYSKYFAALHYRINGYYYWFSDEEENAIEEMKTFLYNAESNSKEGGLLEFECAVGNGYDIFKDYSGESNTGYKKIVPEFAHDYDGMHALTLAGYDDKVWYDYDEDGEKDDNELGAFICVNSWGSTWGDRCRFYIPYRTFSDEMEITTGGIGNGSKLILGLAPKTFQPKLMLKLFLQHNSRNDINLYAGALDANGNEISRQAVSQFNNLGGDHPMRGINGKEKLEIGVNISDVYNESAVGYYVQICDTIVKSSNSDETTKGLMPAENTGKLLACSLLDYSNGDSNPAEYIGNISTYSLKDKISSTAKFSLNNAVIDDGKDISYRYYYNNDNLYTFRFNVSVKSLLKAGIYSKEGKLIVSLFDGYLETGVETKTFDIGKESLDLSKNYILRIYVNNRIDYIKL